LRHGIGVHSGTVLAGNIGGAERLSYALVGDPVNLASRIQGLTKDFKAAILISEATRARLDGSVAVEELPAVRVKGRSEDVTGYKGLGRRGFRNAEKTPGRARLRPGRRPRPTERDF